MFPDLFCSLEKMRNHLKRFLNYSKKMLGRIIDNVDAVVSSDYTGFSFRNFWECRHYKPFS